MNGWAMVGLGFLLCWIGFRTLQRRLPDSAYGNSAGDALIPVARQPVKVLVAAREEGTG